MVESGRRHGPMRAQAGVFLDSLAAYLQKLGPSCRPHLQRPSLVQSGQVKKDAFLPQASNIPTRSSLTEPVPYKAGKHAAEPCSCRAARSRLVSSKTSHVAAVTSTKRPCKEEESKKGGEGSMPGEDRLQDQDRLWPMSRQPGDILALAVAVARMSDVAVESETGEE